MDSAIGQNVAAPIGCLGAFGRQADDREVRGATTNVGDQDNFLAADLPLVVVSRRNRFELETQILEADAAGNFAQRVFGELVGGAVVIDKKYRAAENRFGEIAPCSHFGTCFQGADK